MKKFLLVFAAAGLLLTSCEKDPDFDKMSTDLTVYTDYDNNTDFKESGLTYFIPDSIYSPGSISSERWLKGKTAEAIVTEIANNLDAQGYKRITDATQKDNADFGVQVTLVNKNTQVSGYAGGYDPWWGFGFWGSWWTGYYYPSWYTYSYNTGSLVMEMVNLQKKNDDKKLPIVWRANCKGLLSGSASVDLSLILRAVDQAFNQPPFNNTTVGGEGK